MAISLETRLVSEISWNWQDLPISGSATRTQGRFRRNLAFSSGASSSDPELSGSDPVSSAEENGSAAESDGTQAVDALWFQENAEVAPFAGAIFDLNEMIQVVYGSGIPIRFASLCTLYVFNRSKTAPLVLVNSGSTAASNVLEGTLVNVMVPPGGHFVLCNPASSWTVTSVRNEIQIQNPSSSLLTYDLLLTGTRNG